MNNINDNKQQRNNQTITALPKAKNYPLAPIKGFSDIYMRNQGLYPFNYNKTKKNYNDQFELKEGGIHSKTKLSYLNNINRNNDMKVNIVVNPLDFKFKPNHLPVIWKGGSKSNLPEMNMNITEVKGLYENRPRSTIKKQIIQAKDVNSIDNDSTVYNANKNATINGNVSINATKEQENIKIGNEYSNSTARMISHNIIGLDNLGNTCYMNTCLQNIIHCDPFIQRLIKSKDQIDQIHKQTITKCFYNLCFDIINSKGKISVAPIDFKTAFSRAHFEFRGYDQHDTQECCRVLLDDISIELNRNKIKPKYKELDTNKKPKTQLKKEFTDYIQSIENSIITDTFNGQMQTSFICPCGSQSHTYQRFLDIPILLSEGSHQINEFELEKLLMNHFKDDQIKWEVKCDDCRQKTVHRKIMKLVDLPEVLILSFQRYNSRTRTKNSSSIKYPSMIDLVQFVDLECYDKDKSTQYNLIGISNHSGNMGFGHYYA